MSGESPGSQVLLKRQVPKLHIVPPRDNNSTVQFLLFQEFLSLLSLLVLRQFPPLGSDRPSEVSNPKRDSLSPNTRLFALNAAVTSIVLRAAAIIVGSLAPQSVGTSFTARKAKYAGATFFLRGRTCPL